MIDLSRKKSINMNLSMDGINVTLWRRGGWISVCLFVCRIGKECPLFFYYGFFGT